MGTDIAEKAAKAVHIKGKAGVFVGLGLVILFAMVLFFTLKPFAEAGGERIRAGLNKAKDSIKGAVGGVTGSGGSAEDPRLEGL